MFVGAREGGNECDGRRGRERLPVRDKVTEGRRQESRQTQRQCAHLPQKTGIETFRCRCPPPPPLPPTLALGGNRPRRGAAAATAAATACRIGARLKLRNVVGGRGWFVCAGAGGKSLRTVGPNWKGQQVGCLAIRRACRAPGGLWRGMAGSASPEASGGAAGRGCGRRGRRRPCRTCTSGPGLRLAASPRSVGRPRRVGRPVEAECVRREGGVGGCASSRFRPLISYT